MLDKVLGLCYYGLVEEEACFSPCVFIWHWVFERLIFVLIFLRA